MNFYQFETPFGLMALGEENGAIVRLYLPGDGVPRLMSRPTPLLEKAEQQLQEYFAGKRASFNLPLAPQGTPFQQKVWSALKTIPYGQTRSYKDIAIAVDRPQGFQAVGQANSNNPIPIFIPCHRVISADGSIGGWRGGPEMKQALLDLEGK
jgi:methylated-DNA-[protein]-cysteine S-methyltransferase